MLPIIIIVIGKVEKHLFPANICPASPDITKYNPNCAPTKACAKNKIIRFSLVVPSETLPSEICIEYKLFSSLVKKKEVLF